MSKALDSNGLKHLWSKIRAAFLGRQDPAYSTQAIFLGEVDSTSTSTVFTATVPGITELRDGICVFLTNGVVTSASGWTLNINGLGAKPVYQTMAAAGRVTTTFNIAYTMLFVYNSSRVADGCWDMYYGYNANDNTVGYNIRLNNATATMGAALTRYKLCFTRRDHKLVPSTAVSNSTGTSKALTSEPFDPRLPIYYYSTTTGVAVGAAPSAAYLWVQYTSLDARYAFNTGSTIDAGAPVYLRLVPQADGTVVLDGDNCVVQELPNAADGKVYLWLGYGTSTTAIQLRQEHPIYCYRDGAVREWSAEIDRLWVAINNQ